MEKDNQKNLTMRVPITLYMAAKLHCIEKHISLHVFMSSLLEDFFKKKGK